MILVRAIKEVTTIQQVKDSPTEQIRWDDNSYFSRLHNVDQQKISYNSLLQTENWPGLIGYG